MGDRNGSSTIHYNPAYDKHIPILQKQKRIDKLLVEMLLGFGCRAQNWEGADRNALEGLRFTFDCKLLSLVAAGVWSSVSCKLSRE